MPNLHELHLNETLITDAGLEHLQSSRSLKKVEMRLTTVTEEGVAALKKALPELEVVYDH
jgi:hypothetical protein